MYSFRYLRGVVLDVDPRDCAVLSDFLRWRYVH
jgi:hypothetical protein